jgi:hypothetical protein
MVEMREQISKPEGKGVKGIVTDALSAYGGPFDVDENYEGHGPVVLSLLVDSHWSDRYRSLISGAN